MKVEEEKKKGNEKQTPKKFTEERTEVWNRKCISAYWLKSHIIAPAQ